MFQTMRGLVRARLLVCAGLGLCVFGWRGMFAQDGPDAVPDLPPPVNQSDDPLLKRFVWRSIGPATMGGRLDDIAVNENDPSVYYLGFATGGVWKTENNGTTWTPIFDTYPVSSVGDVELAPSNPRIVYVGTGEPNNRQSSSFGGGVYKSIDAGRTFTYAGLEATQSIGRMVVHPRDPDIVYVAAAGHLFGPNPERGLYKTADGGKTWTNTRFIDNDTGFIDVVMHPTDPNTLLAASYQRRRQPWGFNGGGPGSGIWRTTDGGRNWTRLTGNGLPTNPVIGRIGLAISRSRPNIVYAQIEVGPSGGTGAGVNEDGSLVPPGQRGGGAGGGRGQKPAPTGPDRSGVWRSDDGGKTWQFRSNNNNRPMYYSKIRVDPNNPDVVYTMGASAYKSVDGGRTFEVMAGQSHSDHHALWINPRDSRHLLIGNDGGLDVSYDQGATWEEISLMALGQFYAISADLRKPYYVCGGLQDNGSWCGPSAVRNNQGSTNVDWYRVGGGDGFYTANDPRDWTIGYWESQDGNTNRYNLRTGASTSIRPSAPLTEEQRKQLEQLQQAGGRGVFGGRAQRPLGNVVPPPEAGTAFRFYWSTPFILSPHNPDVVYLGGDRLFKSRDRGDTWSASADLTNNIGRNDRPIMGVEGRAPMASKHDGAASYSNIVTISESPLVEGLVWAGTNDGNLQVSRDGGATFRNVAGNVPGVPKETHVSRVEASAHDSGTAYVTFDGHRTDDHQPYVFVTRDSGRTWTSIASNLPRGHVNVIREDPRNPRLLYLGTEYAFYVSLDGGKTWKRFMNGLPTVRIDDILVHPRENDLIVGTHGRSIWIIDDLTPLQQLSEEVTGRDVHLFDVRPATAWLNDFRKADGLAASKHFRGQNPPGGTAISYYLGADATGDVKITITDLDGRVVRDMEGTKHAGINRVQWNLLPNPTGGRQGRGARGRGARGPVFVLDSVVDPGTYIVRLSVAGQDLVKPVLVEPDRAWGQVLQ
ncbi:MAG TPA: hypothetical protein VD833_18235 [Vicinamibacterales bacterium]|nr:hypothetical protein [Vicinamibacterales bacterium]